MQTHRILRGTGRRGALGALLLGGAGATAGRAWAGRPSGAAKDRWRPLFNGRDLTGWETWLGIPHRSITGLALPRNDKGDYVDAVGLDRDPLGVYSVVRVDGAPAIRISGQIFGALTTLEELESFHLRLEFKWGEKRWAPRADLVRDSGLLYFCHGEQGGADGKAWMRSLELQIQEHDVGDYWAVGPVVCEVRGTTAKGVLTYGRSGEPVTVPGPGLGRRVIKGADAERPTGAWNVVDLYVVGDAAVHVVNGKQVLALTRARRREGEALVPLTRGRIQLQSEGAEVFYRKIAVRSIGAFPADYRP